MQKISRRYKYKVKQKYQEDPFAFLVLWSLFFSAIFLVFAFRGLIAAVFMSRIDVSNEPAITETNNTTDNPSNNSTVNDSISSLSGSTTSTETTNTSQ